MITMWRFMLLVLCVCDQVFTEKGPPCRHEIFSDEKLKGQVLENANVFDKIQLSNKEDNSYRLPNTTKPTHYNIWWKININPPTFTFSGAVDIDLRATQPNINKIVIHSQNLNIESLKLQLGKRIIDTTYSFDLDHQFLMITLVNGSLKYNAHKPAYYRLSVSFDAPMRTDMQGMYSSWYLNFGKIHWMAVTTFASTFARTAVPCYDEPAFKATFDVTITRQENFKSWSNMMRKKSRVSVLTVKCFSGYEDDVYHTTPVMSTYLVAMIVAEFDSVAKVQTVNGHEEVVYEVIARPDAIRTGQSNLIFDLGQTILKELNQYTAINYYGVQKFMKLTHAAIPDFQSGGMENWGLISYRETFLMVDENNTDANQKQFTIGSVIHETAHAWFGDLVTLDWWDALWLNEAFAIFFQYIIGDKVTSMGFETRFINEHVQTALLADSFNSPQPLTNVVGSPDSIDAMYSTITYSKGGSIIRMTDHLLGSKNHKYGLRKYLKARVYQTSRPIDLFESLQEAALKTGAIDKYVPDFTIADYYKTWTEQGGHPILDVDVDRNTRVVNIRQRQFNINSGYATPKMNWVIPITFATASHPDFYDTKPTHIIRDENTTLNLALGADEWILFNKQQTGFYRINYDEYTWDLIAKTLHGPDRELIHEYNRAQIVDDVFQFARSGIMSYKRAFNILSFLRNETAYTPWIAAKNGFSWLSSRLTGTTIEKPVKKMFLEWSSRVMTELKYLPVEGESFLKTNLRLLLPLTTCRFGSEECITTARRLIADLYNWGTEVPVSIRSWVYCTGLREGNPNHYQFLFDRYMYHPVNTEQVQIISYLGCTTDESSLFSLLDAIIKQNFVVRAQDFFNAFFTAVQGNEANTQIVFRYIQENLQAVKEKFNSLVVPLSMVAGRLRSESEVKQDWATRNKASLGDSYQGVFDSANSSLQVLKWAASVQDDIKSYLTEVGKLVGSADIIAVT